MVVQVHAFDWTSYSERVMPAFSQWLLDGDESAARKLFEQTRCAYEERFLPDPMQRLRVWPRARAFTQTLPRGPYSRREYQKLCSAEHFTALSDRYLYKYAPQLYQHSDALRSVWGAIVETFCLPWAHLADPDALQAGGLFDVLHAGSTESVARHDLVALLQQAGLHELAREIDGLPAPVEQGESARNTPLVSMDMPPRSPAADAEDAETSGDEEEVVIAARGIPIGHPPNMLHLRGWLAGISVRAMALFEYLACGRRAMPFGFEAGEPFGAFSGYLTPDETWNLALALDGVLPPAQDEAEEDYLRFRHQSQPPSAARALRLVDEVLPLHAADLLRATRNAAAQGFGLICSVE